jgi:hypothetical protein
MLLAWAETSQGGSRIVLQLADPDDLEPFKAMSLAKGRGKNAIAGQRLMVAFVEIGDDEQPVAESQDDMNRRLTKRVMDMPIAKGGPLSRLAGRWCNDEAFQKWITPLGEIECRGDSETAAALVRTLCGVKSRAEIDHDPKAAEKFERLIRRPFMDSRDKEEKA